ncbi:MAG: HAD family phosphatase [Acidobacteriaceae bacterium]|nr:HAD family phosphatase [Acidobacteriaceae bacterium]
MMPPYDAILFDFDGVLVDTEPLHFQSWCSILAESGVLLTSNFYEQHCRGVYYG